jgi:glycosyltransferase involved in cell wall biosynthesis
MTDKRLRIGFVSTRFSGTDGVSLETEKWVNTLERLGHKCFYFAGESDRPPEKTHLVPEAHFKHPSVEALTTELFMATKRSRLTSQMVQSLKDHLKAHIEDFVGQFMLDMLIVENALSLPVNIPLGLALTEFIAAENFPTIAHHHDFSWERKRFAIGVAGDYLRTAFPPYLPSIRHVVINSFAARQLALRTGASSVLIPNVMDFESPPPPADELTETMPGALGLAEGDHILLQPTRVVPRKRIELAIELTRRLDSGCVLIVSHAAGDEGSAYEKHLRDYAELIGVRVIFASKEFGRERRLDEDGTQVFSLSDAYSHADLVTYPSTVEGFGNAFLETIYHRRPIVISTYEIFKTDIQPKGFRVIGFDDFISDYTVG